MKPNWKKNITRAIRHVLLALVLSTPVLCHADWQLVWSDEFNQPDGSAPNPANWGYDIGNGGWGNEELEYYTSRTNNARIENGQLVIEAQQESYGGSSYTSARLKTQGLWSWAYGRIEASIKIPQGQGIWPAFWMLGTNFASVGWPTCGEIDIMENIGKKPSTVYGSIHLHGGDLTKSFSLPNDQKLASEFHTYGITWFPKLMQFYIDSPTNIYATYTPADLPANAAWPFDCGKFFIILNVAVGGKWPGNPDATSTFPQEMLVDYVRVYREPAPVFK
jgi:beta-glucanase (GH16 family)